MPGATETDFLAGGDDGYEDRAGKKDDPADVAKDGFKAMEKGDADVVSGWSNKLMTAASDLLRPTVLAEQHRKKAEPGSANN